MPSRELAGEGSRRLWGAVIRDQGRMRCGLDGERGHERRCTRARRETSDSIMSCDVDSRFHGGVRPDPRRETCAMTRSCQKKQTNIYAENSLWCKQEENNRGGVEREGHELVVIFCET